MESDNVGVTVIGTHFLDLSQISNDGDKGELTGEHGRGTLGCLERVRGCKIASSETDHGQNYIPVGSRPYRAIRPVGRNVFLDEL